VSNKTSSAGADKKPAEQAQGDANPKADEAAPTDADQAPTAEMVQAMKAAIAKQLGGNIRVLQTKDGKTEAVERKLTADDILSFKDYGDHGVVVTADGRKHRVEATR
jgi:hypothetical protein